MASTAFTIVVVGPGAIGCLFGALLREANHRVIMLDHDPVRAEKINRDGIHIEGISGTRDVKVEATARPFDLPDCDLVIIATKSYDTEKAVMSVAGAVGLSTPVMTLQNGIGNVELIQDAVGGDRTVGGITSQGATLVSPGSIIHAGSGKTVIGTPSNRLTDFVKRAQGVLESAGFAPQISDDLESTIWGKLVINVGINAITAITRLNNGRLLEFEGSQQIMKDAVAEAVSVLKRKNIKLAYEDPLAQVQEVCRLTAKNVSSMLQDVLAKRRTEIDAINGAIVRLATGLDIPTPVNSVITSFVRTIESSYDLQVVRRG